MTRGPETKRRSSNENGATVVEFAVIVVLLLIITFSILEFAFIFAQKHFVENAAREGMRVGILADNYETIEDRRSAVRETVRDYLSTLYRPADIIEPIGVDREEGSDSLKVTVKVKNFFPPLLSGFIPGYVFPVTLSYSAIGIYEDPDEL